MKNLKKLILVFVFLFVFTISAIATTASPDFEETKIATSQNEVEQIKLEQEAKAEEYEKTLEKCSYLTYTTSVTPITDKLNTITKETAKEKDAAVAEKEKEGYIVTVTEKEHNEEKNEYTFNVLNGVVTSSEVNKENNTSYNDKAITEVLNNFKNIDNDDIRIVITTTSSSQNINETETKITEKEAKALVEELKEQGYEASYVQNNEEITETTISSKTSLTEENIANNLQNENTDKEIKDVTVTEESAPSNISESYYDENDANNKYNELVNAGIYESVDKTSSIDYTKETKISGPIKFDWDKDTLEPYTEDVYENNTKIGYKKFYTIEEIVSEAQNKKEENLTQSECQRLLYAHSQNDGWTSNCKEITNTTITESSDNKVNFNNAPQSTRTWSHLDISINQYINIVDENGNVLATNVKGTLSNISATINDTTKLEYKAPTYDGNRLEVRQKTDGNYTKVKNTDKVTITATITYTYNNQIKSKNIILEGYLYNKYNVCSQRNQIGGGFDFAVDLTIDTNNNLIADIATSSTWTFTASKDEETKNQGYYEEYEYATKYEVTAVDEDYVYNVSYIATDYDVTYIGTSNVYNVTEQIYDKYYLIDGEKTTYEVKTVGVIKEDEQCKIEEEQKLLGNLVVNYITTNGKVLSEQLNYTEKEKTPYETLEKTFEGYKLVKIEGNTKGEYVAQNTITVTYIYDIIPTVNTGIIENNIYETILVISCFAFVGLLVFKKKIFE